LTILLVRLLLGICFDLEDISNTRDSVSLAILNTSKFVKNTPLRVTFSTVFSVFGYPDETLSLVFNILLESVTAGALPLMLPKCCTRFGTHVHFVQHVVTDCNVGGNIHNNAFSLTMKPCCATFILIIENQICKQCLHNGMKCDARLSVKGATSRLNVLKSLA